MKINKQLPDLSLDKIWKSIKDLGGFSFYKNPSVVYLVSDNSLYVTDSGEYILADSATGQMLLNDSETYYSNTIEANCYSSGGADSVIPFNKKRESFSTLSIKTTGTSLNNAQLIVINYDSLGVTTSEYIEEGDTYLCELGSLHLDVSTHEWVLTSFKDVVGTHSLTIGQMHKWNYSDDVSIVLYV